MTNILQKAWMAIVKHKDSYAIISLEKTSICQINRISDFISHRLPDHPNNWITLYHRPIVSNTINAPGELNTLTCL